MAILSSVVLFIFGSFIGLSFADFDNKFYWNPVLVHRSIFTHSPLLPLLLFFACRHSLSHSTRLFLIGVSLATAVHLGFDMYPQGWSGYALLNIPFFSQTSAFFSQGWLLGSLAICLILGCRLIRSMGDFTLSLFGLIVLYGISAAKEPGASFFVLMWLLPISFLAFVLSRPKDDPDDPAARLRRLMSKP